MKSPTLSWKDRPIHPAIPFVVVCLLVGCAGGGGNTCQSDAGSGGVAAGIQPVQPDPALQRVASADVTFSDKRGDYEVTMRPLRYLEAGTADRCGEGSDLLLGAVSFKQDEGNPSQLLSDACFPPDTTSLPFGTDSSRHITVSSEKWKSGKRLRESSGETVGNDVRVEYSVQWRPRGDGFYSTTLNGVGGTVSVTKIADGRYRIGFSDVRLLQSVGQSFYSNPPGSSEVTPAPKPTPTPTPKTLTTLTLNGEIIVEDIFAP